MDECMEIKCDYIHIYIVCCYNHPFTATNFPWVDDKFGLK